MRLINLLNIATIFVAVIVIITASEDVRLSKF